MGGGRCRKAHARDHGLRWSRDGPGAIMLGACLCASWRVFVLCFGGLAGPAAIEPPVLRAATSRLITPVMQSLLTICSCRIASLRLSMLRGT
jgi:hypothetical protein